METEGWLRHYGGGMRAGRSVDANTILRGPTFFLDRASHAFRRIMSKRTLCDVHRPIVRNGVAHGARRRISALRVSCTQSQSTKRRTDRDGRQSGMLLLTLLVACCAPRRPLHLPDSLEATEASLSDCRRNRRSVTVMTEEQAIQIARAFAKSNGIS
jgi:hypothetical protein